MNADEALCRAFDVLGAWIPLSREVFEAYLKRCTAEDRGGLWIRSLYGNTYCLLSRPLYHADGSPFDPEFDPARQAAEEQFILLVFDENGDVAGDLAAYGMSLGQLKAACTAARLEEESDWLYWQREIVLDAAEGCDDSAEILLYTNAYTAKDSRRNHIFTNMLEMVREAVSSRHDTLTLLSCISLDPDVPCYGKDRTDTPYIYSMKDEPVRILNARIMEKLGWQSVRLETDEPVEDGAILRFACQKLSVMTI